MSDKNYFCKPLYGIKLEYDFNDPRPAPEIFRVICASCRCEMTITVKGYPHGPRSISACPVCGTSSADNLNTTSMREVIK